MPSSIKLNGRTIYRPGVYGNVDVSALGGKGTSTGNVALIADLPGFEQDTPTTFTGARGLKDYDAADDNLKLLASLAFNSANDDEIPGGANSLTVVSVNASTQAFLNMLDIGAAVALVLKSKVWGKAGNRLNYDLSKTGDVHSFTFVRDGITEEFELTVPRLGSIIYAGGVLTTAIVEWTATQLRYEWTRLLGAGDGLDVATDWDHAPCEGVLDLTLSVAVDPAETLDITVTGTTLAGAPQNEIVSFTNGDGTGPLSTVNSYGSVTRVQGVLSGGTDPNVTIAAQNGKLISNTGRKISGVLTELGQLAGVTTVVEDPRAGSIDAADVDLTDGEVSVLVSVDVRADTAELIRGLAASKLVVASRGASGEPADLSSDLAGNFAGGSDVAPIGTDPWQNALDAILDKDIQIVTVLDTTVAVHALLAKHCNDAALQGYERSCWIGGEGQQTKAQVKTEAAALNTRYVSAVFDQIEVDHPDGSTPTLEPPYLALMMAGMQAGSNVAHPLTWNRPRVRDAFQTWSPNLDADELIAGGICMLTQDSLGWKVERSVTTYLTDDNPFLSEMSAWESIQTCVRDLRNVLNSKVGNPNVAGTKGKTKGKVIERLGEQVELGWIKAYRNIDVEDLGDRFKIIGEIAPTEPLNFFEIALSAVRI